LITKSVILNDFAENVESSLQYCDGSAKIDKIRIVCSIAEELENRIFNWTLPLIFRLSKLNSYFVKQTQKAVILSSFYLE
jgi:hypothetical protein